MGVICELNGSPLVEWIARGVAHHLTCTDTDKWGVNPWELFPGQRKGQGGTIKIYNFQYWKKKRKKTKKKEKDTSQPLQPYKEKKEGKSHWKD